MKKILYFAIMMTLAVLVTACHNDDVIDDMKPAPEKDDSRVLAQGKTVLVYLAGKNNLTDSLNADLEEIKVGSRRISDDQNLLVFVRRNREPREIPWLARIRNGQVTDSVSLKDMGIKGSDGQMRACDPVVMEGVLQYVFSHYPASDGYGLVLGGHGSGWLIMDEVNKPQTRAYGVDYGEYIGSTDERWINITTLAELLRGFPHLKYIMADCCNFMCLENLYELRDVCDYIIGSPAEIPSQGAPYNQIVPDLFADGRFYANIVEKYYNSIHGELPLTVVKTSEMERVAQASRQAMQVAQATIGEGYADMTGMIHYYYTHQRFTFDPAYKIFYDAGDFFLAYTPKEVYQQWRQALDQAIVDYRMATYWSTDKFWRYMYSDFIVTKEKMHGVSMFVPQDPAGGDYAQYNEDIKQLEWWKVVCEG